MIHKYEGCFHYFVDKVFFIVVQEPNHELVKLMVEQTCMHSVVTCEMCKYMGQILTLLLSPCVYVLDFWVIFCVFQIGDKASVKLKPV